MAAEPLSQQGGPQMTPGPSASPALGRGRPQGSEAWAGLWLNWRALSKAPCWALCAQHFSCLRQCVYADERDVFILWSYFAHIKEKKLIFVGCSLFPTFLHPFVPQKHWQRWKHRWRWSSAHWEPKHRCRWKGGGD